MIDVPIRRMFNASAILDRLSTTNVTNPLPKDGAMPIVLSLDQLRPFVGSVQHSLTVQVRALAARNADHSRHMSEDRPTTDWPSLIAGGMFELKTPITVVIGYVGMLNTERAGPLTDKQRTFLQQIQQATRQISQIVEALAGLASLEGGAWSTWISRKDTVSLRKLLAEVADHPFLQSAGRVDVRAHSQYDEVIAAPRLLSHALAGLARFVAVQLNCDRPLCIWIVDALATSETWIVLAAPEQIQDAVKTPREKLTPLDERAGRVSMDLPFAGAIVRAHGGELLALQGGTPGAVVALPRPTPPSD